jgi:hypothetical protein
MDYRSANTQMSIDTYTQQIQKTLIGAGRAVDTLNSLESGATYQLCNSAMCRSLNIEKSNEGMKVCVKDTGTCYFVNSKNDVYKTCKNNKCVGNKEVYSLFEYFVKLDVCQGFKPPPLPLPTPPIPDTLPIIIPTPKIPCKPFDLIYAQHCAKLASLGVIKNMEVCKQCLSGLECDKCDSNFNVR